MKKNNKKGFTLVELVIVVAVMAILVAVAIPTIGSITKTAKDTVYDTNCKTIESMLKLAEADKAKTGTATNLTLSESEVRKALVDAKLGIIGGDSGTSFYYHTGTGAVNNSSTKITADGVTDTVITITYDKTGNVTAPAASTTPVTPKP